jgi:5'-deoxy-5'-methylthioadenosine phosphorylase
MIAIIGGSGLNRLEGLERGTELHLKTRWGSPSGPIIEGLWHGVPTLFLPRHGAGHSLPPHRINYRANLWALKEAGAQAVLAVAASGGIRKDCQPGTLVVPDQLIDYTWGRDSTFFDGDDAPVVHVDFTEPYHRRLREALMEAALAEGIPLIGDGVYACTQGPRLESAAEVRRLAQDGCTLVGMTGMPEAALARELGLPYACLSVVANLAAGLDPQARVISIEEIHHVLAQGMQAARQVLARAAGLIHAGSAPPETGES